MELITYTLKQNINTREPLRRIKEIQRLREIADCYWQIMEQTSNPEYRRVWQQPSQALPKKTVIPGQKYSNQTPREYIEGFIEKINRIRGNDLSTRQCEGFALFSDWFSEEFGSEPVVFAEHNSLATQPLLTLFN